MAAMKADRQKTEIRVTLVRTACASRAAGESASALRIRPSRQRRTPSTSSASSPATAVTR